MGVLEGKVGVWLVSAPAYDVAGRMWSTHGPIAGYDDGGRLGCLLGIAPDVPVLMDAVYATQDEEYLDARQLRSVDVK